MPCLCYLKTTVCQMISLPLLYKMNFALSVMNLKKNGENGCRLLFCCKNNLLKWKSYQHHHPVCIICKPDKTINTVMQSCPLLKVGFTKSWGEANLRNTDSGWKLHVHSVTHIFLTITSQVVFAILFQKAVISNTNYDTEANLQNLFSGKIGLNLKQSSLKCKYSHQVLIYDETMSGITNENAFITKQCPWNSKYEFTETGRAICCHDEFLLILKTKKPTGTSAVNCLFHKRFLLQWCVLTFT